jgi:Skp family chaperone for outer membrane proteins
MRTRVFAVALAAVAATGFGLAAQAQKPAAPAAAKVVVYKSPT